jgi:hypothetical protein
MKQILFISLIGLFITNVQAQTFFTSDYIALTVPQHYEGTIWHINDSLKQELTEVKDLKNNNKLLNSFPNTVSNVTVYKVTADGELKFAGIGISGKNEVYQVIYDFSQTQTITWNEDGTNQSVLIGVGVRMVAKVKTKKAGINLASPFGLVANIEKVEGSLEVRVTGISSRKINELIPTTTDLSPSSISVALQAVATIKSHIYDAETIITPQYLAYNKIDKTVDKESIKLIEKK